LSRGTEVRHRVGLSHHCRPICSYITPSISGWIGNTAKFRLSATRMTSSATVVRKRKQRGFGNRWKIACQTVALPCIRRRQRLSAARIRTGKRPIGQSHSTFSAIVSSPGWQCGVGARSAYPIFRLPAQKRSRRFDARCAIGVCNGAATRGSSISLECSIVRLKAGLVTSSAFTNQRSIRRFV